jgi:hypothetical protein
MNARYIIAILLAFPSVAFGQGAILETPDDLQGLAAPPGYRGAVPKRVDLTPRLPIPRSQGATATCTSWAATFAGASFALRARGKGSALSLSPSFTYNQVSRDQWCASATSLSATLNTLRDVGALPVEEFAFDGGWCGRLPTKAEVERASQFRIRGWAAFDAKNIDSVKEQIARGVPVIFAMPSTPKMRALQNDAVLEEDDQPGQGHAMIAAGYDDTKKAFLIQNSWGRSWATGGHGWFGYEFWKRNAAFGFVIE